MGYFKEKSRLLRGKLRSRVLSNHGFGVVADTKNGIFIVDPKDFGVGRTLLRDGEYDIECLELLLNIVEPDFTAAFIGAHIGTFLVPVAKKVKYVVGYEANPDTFMLLKYNCVLNKAFNCDVYNYCIGNKNTLVNYKINSINMGNSRINPEYFQNGLNEVENSIEMVTFDGHLNNAEKKYDLIVMDIEGAECLALEGMQESLKHCKYLYTEYGPNFMKDYEYSIEQFIALLEPHFPNMYYMMDCKLKKFFDYSWQNELKKLSNGELLINLLFCKTEIQYKK